MSELHERLASARKAAGFRTASDAAQALEVKEPTYIGHENGHRGFKRDAAERYARRFDVSMEWLLTGRGPRERRALNRKHGDERTVPLVGFVGAGAAANFFDDQGQLDEIIAPEGSTDTTVAVEIRGESLGALFDRWLVFYDDVKRPVTTDQVGKLCVVGLADGRILIKKIQRARGKGLFHLLSNTEGPILDVEIEWAAKVKIMVPR